MPRCTPPLALLASLLALSGCAGLGVFLDDTHSPKSGQNRPIGNSETIRRVEGQPVATEPLIATAGNVWPGPVQPEPTLQDLAKVAPPVLEGATAPPLANVPNLQIPAIPHHLQPRPGDDGTVLNGPISGGATGGVASPQGVVAPTSRGPAVSTRAPSGIPQSNVPGNPGGIVVPNGNGTSTVIAPDGTVSTIPTPAPTTPPRP